MSNALSADVQRMNELISRSQFGEVETAFASAAQKAPTEVDSLFPIVEKLDKAGQGEKAGNLLEPLVPVLLEKEPHKAVRVVEAIAKVSPKNPRLKDLAVKTYQAEYASIPGFDKIVARATDESKGSDFAFVDSLMRQLAFIPGDYLFHEQGWGLGKVTAMDAAAGTLTIDFVDKKGHTVKLGAAARFFAKLSTDNILVQKAADGDGLKARAGTDPAGVILTVLKSLNNSSNLKRIKAELCPSVISAKEWSKWWQGARKALAKHPYVKVGAGNNPTIERLQTAVPQETEAREMFENARRLFDKLNVMRRYLKESDSSAERKALLKGFAESLLPLANKDHEKLLVCFMIADLAQAEEDLGVSAPASAEDLVRDAEKLLEMTVKLSDAEYQERALEMHRALNKDGWNEVFGRAFLQDMADVWDRISERLLKGDNQGPLLKAVKTVLDDPEAYPLQYLWIARRAILGQKLPQGLELPTSDRLFERLTWLANKVLTRIERGESKLKDTLASLRSAMTDRQGRLLQAAIAGRDEDSASHLLHAIKRSRWLSETHLSTLRDVITRAFPALLQREEKLVPLGQIEEAEGILATANGRRKREDELRRVQEEDLPAVAKQIGEALAMGDISENAELDAAREKESRLKERAKEIMEELKRVKVVSADEVDAAKAGFGTRVTLKNPQGKQVVYTILGPYEADHANNIISNESPIAQGILGKAAGEDAVVTTPEGSVNYKVVAIEKALA
ncbi:MAG: GreA/GreB family elongation factor [Planctomycetaceae bacterium]|nr:GreA/GreB family elongation factor [Planctomycetaceae bacterium]GIK52516.1 MAG: transcript cleavage factor [Planctomycetota bacterium]